MIVAINKIDNLIFISSLSFNLNIEFDKNIDLKNNYLKMTFNIFFFVNILCNLITTTHKTFFNFAIFCVIA